MKTRIYILLLTLLAVGAQAEPLTDSSAVARAEAFMGFQSAFQVESFTFDSLPNTKTLESLPLPYLEDKANLNVVSVTAHDVRLTSGDWCKTPRDFTVYLDADSGTFLVATSFSDAVKTPLLHPFMEEKIEKYFWQHFIKFEGYATEVPPKSFRDVHRWTSVSRPCQAVEVYIYCLRFCFPRLEPGIYWCVVGRGVPDFREPVQTYDTLEIPWDLMTVIDARDGAMRGFGSVE